VVADVQAGGIEQDPSSGRLPPAARLQILTTEHWSLLSTRALSWNEAFSRASMFLSALSGGVIALALAAQATSFDDRFTTFALLLLTPILFLGIATFVRLVEINREGCPLGDRDEPAAPCLPGGRPGASAVLRHGLA
jgi:hypothetical protein